jgi:hypothetical protein
MQTYNGNASERLSFVGIEDLTLSLFDLDCCEATCRYQQPAEDGATEHQQMTK